MPKAKHQDAITRQWEILRMIPGSAPGKTTTEIVKALDVLGISVTKRTIERDLMELSINFSLLCNDEKKPYRWQWMEGGGINLPALTLTDAFSLKIVESTLKPLVPRSMQETLNVYFKEADNKLKLLSKNTNHANWVDKVRNVSPALSLLPPKIDDAVLDTVQAALLKDKQVEVEYQSMGNDHASAQLLNPLAMVQRGPVTYLVATMNSYSDIRLYAVHRIQGAKQKDNNVIVPDGFSIDEYINNGALNFSTGKKIKLQAKVDEGLCRILEETPLALDQTITYKDDCSMVTATVDDSWQLTWWLLSQGSAIEVVKPEKLRKNILSEIRDALEQYEPGDVK